MRRCVCIPATVIQRLMRCLSECVNSHFQTDGQVGRAWQDEVVREANRDQNGTRGLLPRAADMLDGVRRASSFSLQSRVARIGLLFQFTFLVDRLASVCKQPGPRA